MSSDDWKDKLPLWVYTNGEPKDEEIIEEKENKWMKAFGAGANKLCFDKETRCDSFLGGKFPALSLPATFGNPSSLQTLLKKRKASEMTLEKQENDNLLFVKSLDCAGLCNKEIKIDNGRKIDYRNLYLYKRPAVVGLLCALDDFIKDNNKIMCIHGSPGGGKSTTVFHYFENLNHDQTTINIAVWIHFGEFHTKVVKYQNINGVFEFYNSDVAPLESIRAENFLDCNLIILDSVIQKNHSDIYRNLNTIKSCKLICITSLGFHLKLQVLADEKIVSHLFPAWNLDELKNAVVYDSIWDVCRFAVSENPDLCITIEDRQAAVTEKYFYSGASARWMFGAILSDVISEIKSCVSRCTDLKKLFDYELGDQNSSHVHQLTTRLSNIQTIIASEYIIRELYRVLKPKLIHNTKIIARLSGNRRLEGMVVEIDFIEQLRSKATQTRDAQLRDRNSPISTINLLQIIDNVQTEEFWPVSRVVEYDVKNLTTVPDFEENLFLVPNDSANPTFDLINIFTKIVTSENQTVRNKTIRFVNVTIAKQHSLKLFHCSNFLSELANLNSSMVFDAVEFYFVRRIGSDLVNPASPIGTLAPWKWDPKELKQAVFSTSDNYLDY